MRNKHEAVRTVLSELTIYEQKAFSLVELSRAMERIKEIALQLRRFGYRRVYQLLRREGDEVNHRTVYRLCWETGPSVNKNFVKS